MVFVELAVLEAAWELAMETAMDAACPVAGSMAWEEAKSAVLEAIKADARGAARDMYLKQIGDRSK